MSLLGRDFFLHSIPVYFRRYLHLTPAISIAFNFDVIKANQNQVDRIFSDLDDVFLPPSQLHSVASNLNSPAIGEHLKQSFWTKLLQSSFSANKISIVDSLLLFILQDSAQHTPVTLICVLNILGVRGRFAEFESLYRLLINRLSPQQLIIFSGDLAACLCLTPFYKEANDYFHLAVSNKLPLTKFMCLLNVSAKYDSPDEIFNLVEKFSLHGLRPADEFYVNFIGRLDKKDADKELKLMRRLLDAVRVNGWFLSSIVAGEISKFFERYHWKGTFGANIKVLRCSVCNTELEKFSISEEDCASLARNFHDIAILGTNEDELYLTTTPSELDSLQSYTKDRARKFDCVIDLPNFLHSTLAHSNLSIVFEKDQVGMLRNALLYLHKHFQFNHFCLAGKKLRFSGGKAFWDPIIQLGNSTGITVRRFFTSTKSDDDTFIIYLALWSGPQCYVISNDEFRQHRFTLGAKLGDIFSKWQAARQIRSHPGSATSFIRPLVCHPRIHGNLISGWHIPYEIKNKRPSYAPPNTWLCLRPPS